MKFYQNWH